MRLGLLESVTQLNSHALSQWLPSLYQPLSANRLCKSALIADLYAATPRSARAETDA